MARSSTKVTQRLSVQMGISQSSAMRIFRADKWHPYELKMLQIADASRSGRPNMATDEGTSTPVLVAMTRISTKRTRRLSVQMRITNAVPCAFCGIISGT
ncbi:hypothetical protein AVEN_24512-1 [Araneus ventricosus]|uniref:Uncharacterized protein n=1 Tax=Araneus ventricosus TaxID=182803 RepID=A0A4Y2J1U2_ARAVE|nr:hypothetical protein AVEN_24512-1 [Araneus ventricosus]